MSQTLIPSLPRRAQAMSVAVSIHLAFCWVASAQVERIWLTHRTHDPGKLVVNWTTATPGDSTVRFGLTENYDQVVTVNGNTTLHHVEIPLKHKNALYHYSVSTGPHRSPDAAFKGYPTDRLRVAVVADWQGKPRLDALLKDDVHLLLTAGDNIPDLWRACGVGVKDGIQPYCNLIDAYPELFRSVPFMPALGNHDREIRPRGKQPPPEPVYDIDATAFRRFFELPDEEWKWHFDVPELRVRFIALDLNHISDQGTTWQTCHPLDSGSAQFQWYRELMRNRPPGFVVTLYNEKNSSVRSQVKGEWGRMISQGTVAISGFGYFGERAEVNGFSYFNTSLSGKGDKYPDPASKVFHSEDNYILITVDRSPARMTVELKRLDGMVLDRVLYDGYDGRQR